MPYGDKGEKIAPNMSIYRQDDQGNDTDEYYIMNPFEDGKTPYMGNYSSSELSAIQRLGNPVAIANMAWAKENTYRLTPDFNIKYELLGTEAQTSRLTLNGRVDFDIYANIRGGGLMGQAGALRHGIARALEKEDESLRPVLKKAGMLTRDAREKERKKPGQPGARKRFQFSKR